MTLGYVRSTMGPQCTSLDVLMAEELVERPSVSGVAAVGAGALPRLPHHGEPLFVGGPVSSN